MAVGVGGQGFLGVAVETTPGTYVAPTTYVPILSESFQYTEDRYISPAIRKSTIANDVKQNFYHAEGDIDMEVDTSTIVYFLHACRLTVVKTGAGPYNYVYTPSAGASAGPSGNNATVKTLSITVVRNLQVFKYVGWVLARFRSTRTLRQPPRLQRRRCLVQQLIQCPQHQLLHLPHSRRGLRKQTSRPTRSPSTTTALHRTGSTARVRQHSLASVRLRQRLPQHETSSSVQTTTTS
jgi:hypothetical protein